MTDVLDMSWKISDQAIANVVGDETVVLHLGNGTYFGLDPVGTLLWEALANGETPGAACETILAGFAIDRATVERDLRVFLAELEDNGLVVQG